ncbi:MAG: hypothetical protein WC520_03160 [Candidatus Paceibacterota bacterium]
MPEQLRETNENFEEEVSPGDSGMESPESKEIEIDPEKTKEIMKDIGEAYEHLENKYLQHRSDENYKAIEEFMECVNTKDFSKALDLYRREKEAETTGSDQTEIDKDLEFPDYNREEVKKIIEKEITPEKAMKAMERMIGIYRKEVKELESCRKYKIFPVGSKLHNERLEKANALSEKLLYDERILKELE